jgi:hypothetical protein
LSCRYPRFADPDSITAVAGRRRRLLVHPGTPDGNDDYGYDENMVRWHYHISGFSYNTILVYVGGCIE